MVDAQRLAGELGRGAYDARRAAALAGAPRSTLHYWARKNFYRPSVSPEPHVRLWSWLDLLALRTIDWLRKTKGTGEPRPRLRIIPGKLHGEPHLLDTRIPSAAVYALVQDGYDLSDIQRIYPGATPEDLTEAIDLERSLNERAA